MAIYVGVNNKPKEVTDVYVAVNGVPKEVSDIYTGKDGEAKAIYSGVKPGETVFTTSGVFTVPKGVKSIDVFCVGGGGGSMHGVIGNFAGPGGGYTNYRLAQTTKPGEKLTITVGAGGEAGTSWSTAKDGGQSSITGAFIGVAANGGKAPASQTNGGNGGSGGAAAKDIYKEGVALPGHNGSDGYEYNNNGTPGKGQGTNTQYFGETNGTVYSDGGMGVYYTVTSDNKYISGLGNPDPVYNLYGVRSAGDGDGGVGLCPFTVANPVGNGYYSGVTICFNDYSTAGPILCKGSSGCCIVRWGKQ